MKAPALGRGDGEIHGQVRLPDAQGPEKDHILLPLDEAQRVEAFDLVVFDARLEGEVEVGEGLHGREPGGAHGRLEPALIAQRDVAPEERGHRFAGGEHATVGAAEVVVEGFERPGHLEIGELARSRSRRGRAVSRPAVP